MPRLLFEKTGNAVWISHLDLMRLFQRAFKRAGLHLTHTQGFNPRPSVSIALPLSVGVESYCELLDFDLDGESVGNEEIASGLNSALVEGVRVLTVYDNASKIKNLACLSCEVELEYDNGVPEGALDAIRGLFARESLGLDKKGKNGVVRQDIIPLIKRIKAEQKDEHTVVLSSCIYCQNPALNPAHISAAVYTYLPNYTPDFSKCRRLEVYDVNEKVFR